MQEVQPLDDLSAPGLEHPLVDFLEALQVGLEGAGGHELGDQYDVLVGLVAIGLGFAHFPGVIEPDDVRVLEAFEHFCFFTKPLFLNF